MHLEVEVEQLGQAVLACRVDRRRVLTMPGRRGRGEPLPPKYVPSKTTARLDHLLQKNRGPLRGYKQRLTFGMPALQTGPTSRILGFREARAIRHALNLKIICDVLQSDRRLSQLPIGVRRADVAPSSAPSSDLNVVEINGSIKGVDRGIILD